MKLKNAMKSFAIIFSIAFLVSSGVNFLWNLLFHGLSSVDWNVSFGTAFALGIIITWTQERGGGRQDS